MNDKNKRDDDGETFWWPLMDGVFGAISFVSRVPGNVYRVCVDRPIEFTKSLPSSFGLFLRH